MSLLAEEIVEEWLNRQGYFTIRGIKLGVQEIDLLAVKPVRGGLDCRHIEVQSSINPTSYLCPLPKAVQKRDGVGPYNARKRTVPEMRRGAAEWVEKKFNHPKKLALQKRLYDGKWSKELVLNAVLHAEELKYVRELGIRIHRLPEIVRQMNEKRTVIPRAAGGDFLDLVLLPGRTHF